MQTERVLTKNRFTTAQYDPKEEKIVFISYKRDPDRYAARKCAEILQETLGLHYWFDEDDECMAEAKHQKSDINLATCIERGLDVSSALLSVISPTTWYSAWVPYEIGGARGRQRFFKPFTPYSNSDPPPVPHPLIAHYLRDRQQKKAPAYVALGIPLVTLDEVSQWAKSVEKILSRIRIGMKGISLSTETRDIQDNYGIQEIYDWNTRHYVY